MKTYILTLLAACLGLTAWSQTQQPQQTQFNYPESVKLYQDYLNTHPNAKTQAQASRIINYCSFDWVSNAWEYEDTSNYTYTGTHGGDVQSQQEPFFDERTVMQWDGMGWQNRYLYEKVYNANDQVLVSTTKQWDGMGWYVKYRTTNTYDSNGNQTSVTYEIWSGSAVVYDYRYLYIYNTDGSLHDYQKDVWNGSIWEADFRIELTYTSSGLQETELRQQFTGVWENQYYTTQTYDAHDNLLSRTVQNWNGGTWQNINRTSYTYDANNNKLTYLYEQYNGGVWENDNRETYTYDANNNKISTLAEEYNAGTWQYSFKGEFTYDAQNRVTDDSYFNWSGSAWVPYQRYTYVYDLAGNLLQLSYYEDNMGTWQEKNQVFYTYNSYDQFLTGMSKALSGAALVNNDSVIYHYELFDDGTGIEQLTKLDSKVMPNPFKTNVALQVSITATGTYTFEVYNLAGQKLYEEQRYWPAGQQTLVWEGQDANGNVIPQGIYFFTISSGRHMASGKLIKQ